MVDEYQDLGAGLHRLVETLLDADVEITAVGDVDQSIYGWAGGTPSTWTHSVGAATSWGWFKADEVLQCLSLARAWVAGVVSLVCSLTPWRSRIRSVPGGRGGD
jgi:ATP-dependent exoDNAse (exonuclease V) beta subunit